MSPMSPEVSVVVPTHNRAASLVSTLEALAGQRDAPPFEVVIVDDASSDDTPARIREWVAGARFPIVALRQDPGTGPAAARNRGWRAARGQVICFTDDDCVPQPGWMSNLVGGLDGAGMAQGRTLPNPDQREQWGPFSHTVEVKEEGGFYETCNMAYNRTWLEASGGFDEAFRHPYGEDTELAWRVKAGGARSTFVADAVVYHAIGPSDFGRCLRLMRRREALVHLLHLHPELRAIFPARWYHKQTHPPAVALVLSMTAIGLRPRSAALWAVGAACAALYARACLRTWRAPKRTRQWALVMPAALVADLVEVAVLAAASARERTLFL
jgi:glycosyltransferase involved in cell wall biosynthesis